MCCGVLQSWVSATFAQSFQSESQWGAVRYNMLRCVAVCCGVLQHLQASSPRVVYFRWDVCNTLQHTATHCTTTHYNALHLPATHSDLILTYKRGPCANDSFVCLTWLIHVCDAIRAYATELIHVCDKTSSNFRRPCVLYTQRVIVLKQRVHPEHDRENEENVTWGVMFCVAACCRERIYFFMYPPLTRRQDWRAWELQCTAVCRSVVQCVVACCSLLQRGIIPPVYPWRTRRRDRRAWDLQCVKVCCSVFKCVAVCCSVLQSVAGCCRVLQRDNIPLLYPDQTRGRDWRAWEF